MAGKTIDVTLKLSSGIHTERRKQKKNITREKVRENNDRIAAKNLARLLNANFREDDMHVTLTYKEAPSQDQAKKDRAAFIRKLRKIAPDLKYVAVTEWEHTRIHHHIVLSGCTLDQIDELWQEIRTGGYDDLRGFRGEVDVEKNKGHIVIFSVNYDEIVEKYADDDAVYFENGDL